MIAKKATLLYYKKLIYEKLVLGRPNWQETFSTQTTEVKKLIIFFSFSNHNFEDKVTNFDKRYAQKRIFLWYRSHIVK